MCGMPRRKKTRYTGEKPVCSLCQRIYVQCLYLPRGTLRPSGVERARSSSTSYAYLPLKVSKP